MCTRAAGRARGECGAEDGAADPARVKDDDDHDTASERSEPAHGVLARDEAAVEVPGE